MYTKGDWKVGESRKWSGFFIKAGEKQIADIPLYVGNTPEETEANAHLLVQAPKLYEACKAQHEAIDILFARLIELDKGFFPSKSGKPWEAMKQGNEAIAPVEGK